MTVELPALSLSPQRSSCQCWTLDLLHSCETPGSPSMLSPKPVTAEGLQDLHGSSQDACLASLPEKIPQWNPKAVFLSKLLFLAW